MIGAHSFAQKNHEFLASSSSLSLSHKKVPMTYGTFRWDAGNGEMGGKGKGMTLYGQRRKCRIERERERGDPV